MSGISIFAGQRQHDRHASLSYVAEFDIPAISDRASAGPEKLWRLEKQTSSQKDRESHRSREPLRLMNRTMSTLWRNNCWRHPT
jgi:hypothetical protein